MTARSSKLPALTPRQSPPAAEMPGVCGACGSRRGVKFYPFFTIDRVLQRYRCDEHVPEDVRERRA